LTIVYLETLDNSWSELSMSQTSNWVARKYWKTLIFLVIYF
jgi:hypothetical protein